MYVETAHQYARDVLDGDVLACKWVRLACERHLDDLDRSGSEGFPYRFDREAAAQPCRFIENLPHVKGRWGARGETIELEPWQCFFVCVLFGWLREDGTRRFRRAYLEVPRKNAKSTLAAAIGLYCLVEDDEYGAEVYSGATTEEQALEVFRPAWQMVSRTEDLREFYGLEMGGTQMNPGPIYRTADGSRFKTVIGKPGDGPSPHLAIIDEYHEHDSSDQYDTMETGMGSREQPLMLVITTAGDDLAGPCYSLHGKVQQILEGTVPGNDTWGLIYTIDEDDDWTTEEALRKANPNYDVSVFGDYLRARQRDAIHDPRQQGIVKIKHFDLWVSSRSPWMNLEDWNLCGDTSLELGDFHAEECWMGLDFAAKIDLCSVVVVFRDGDRYVTFSRHYLPDQTIVDRGLQHFRQWEIEGHLEVIPGGEIDFDYVRDDVAAWVDDVFVLELAYDPMYAVETAQKLERMIGCRRIDMNMGSAKTFSPPMFELQAAVTTGRFAHDGNPVLTWCVSNVVVRPDPRGNVYPRKDSPEKKIDGAVALFLAANRAMVADPDKRSIFEEYDEEEWRQGRPSGDREPEEHGDPDEETSSDDEEGEDGSDRPRPGQSIYSQYSEDDWA